MSKEILEKLIGQYFGDIEVVGLSNQPYVSPKGRVMPQYECICHACGNRTLIRSDAVRRNTSCGCAKARCKPTNLIGQKFGKLTVVDFAEPWTYPSGKVRNQWKCQCECGNTKVVRANALISGGTKSCGCLKNKNSRNTNEIYVGIEPIYIEHEDYYTVKIKDKCEFLIDKEDYDFVKQYNWSLSSDGYIITHSKLKLHKMLIEGDIIDHINHNKLDNRKSNLRVCTTQQNNINSPINSKNKSGVIGVIQDKYGKWIAYITLNGQRHHLGIFEDKIEAIKSRLIVEKDYFGEFSPQKELWKEYGINI